MESSRAQFDSNESQMEISVNRVNDNKVSGQFPAMSIFDSNESQKEISVNRPNGNRVSGQFPAMSRSDSKESQKTSANAVNGNKVPGPFPPMSRSDLKESQKTSANAVNGNKVPGPFPPMSRSDSKESQKTSANGANGNKVSGPVPSMSRAYLERMLAKSSQINFPLCANISKYEKLAKIGQGTFGEVFKARDRKTRKFVASKKILMENEKEGFPITAVREIKILHQLKHENIVNLIEVCQSNETTPNSSFCKPTFYLIFDFCEHDLAGLINNPGVKFSLGEIKMIMKQLLNGLFFMHSNNILHRDMKAANILITKEGILKIADFGLSRPFTRIQPNPNRFTNRVVTLWYRPPELLLGERNYGPPIDLWGAGCIMAELWTRVPILQGSCEQHQLKIICDLCGSITPETLSGVEKLELYSKIVLPSKQKRKVKERLRAHVKNEDALELIDQLLIIDPEKRIDADDALSHDFFYTDPMPCAISKLFTGISKSQFEYNKKQNVQTVVAPHQPRRNDDQYYDPVY